MLILFDHGTPKGVARALRGHTVITAKARGWDQLTNGALLNEAEEAAVDLLFTTDQNIRYQQDLPEDCPRRFDWDDEMVTRTFAS